MVRAQLLGAMALVLLGACAVSFPDYPVAGTGGKPSSATSAGTGGASVTKSTSSTSSTSSSASTSSTGAGGGGQGSPCKPNVSQCDMGFCWGDKCTSLTAITAGDAHTCGLLLGGNVQCWGDDNHGQLGDKSTAMQSQVPVAVLGSSFASISAGNAHTCARTMAGGAQCWGYNNWGQLGNGSMADQYQPANVSGLTSGVSAVSAGGLFSCALVSGAVECWGANANGQLGNPTTLTYSSTPVAVAGLAAGVTAIATGSYHACAIQAGVVKCWGSDNDGQLGNGSMTNSPTAVDVQELPSGMVTAIAAGGHHSCAVVDGSAYCWGNNFNGELGNDSTTNSSTAALVKGFPPHVASIAAGAAHTCALTDAGAVYCWGSNGYGQLGNSSGTDSHVPVAVAGSNDSFVAITAGDNHACALTSQGTAECWGDDANGQLGNDGTNATPFPTGVVEP